MRGGWPVSPTCHAGHFAVGKARTVCITPPPAFQLSVSTAKFTGTGAIRTAPSFTVQQLNLCRARTVSPIYLTIGSYGSILTWRRGGGGGGNHFSGIWENETSCLLQLKRAKPCVLLSCCSQGCKVNICPVRGSKN